MIHPLDIFEIKKIGIENWHRDFSWPLKITEQRTILNEIDLIFKKKQKNANDELKDILWVGYSRIVVGLSRTIGNMLILERLKDKDFDKKHYKELSLITGKPIPNSFKKKDRITDLIRNIYYNTFIGKKLPLILNNTILSAEYPSIDMIEYAKQFDQEVFYMPKSFYYSFNNKTNYHDDLKEFLDSYLLDVEAFLFENNLGINKKNITKIKNQLFEDYKLISKNVNQIKEKVKYFNKEIKFLAHSVGDIFIRSICVAMSSEGHKVISFPHGNIVGISSDFIAPSVLMGVSNTFICPNSHSQKLFNKSINKHLKPYGKNIKTEYLQKNNYYKKINDLVKNDSIPDSIENVMIIEDPLNPNFQPWPFYLDFNIRKAIFLKGECRNLILKKHPDRLKESEGVYEKYYDEIITDPFEKVYNKGDIFIFEDIGTTTFGFALLTKKPIIIFSHNIEQTWNDAQELIRKRCTVIPSWYGKDGRIYYDESKLISAVKKKPAPLDNQFIKLFFD